ncbi:MAG TPA: hypothetical protein VH143_15900 [Kofleriaceae bacterium]|nr:hypothetical protein [Kofleriaceae bacterium]
MPDPHRLQSDERDTGCRRSDHIQHDAANHDRFHGSCPRNDRIARHRRFQWWTANDVCDRWDGRCSRAVPAMSASVVAPTQVTITSNFNGVRILSTSDYVLTWTGGTTGTVGLEDSYGIDGDFTLVDCSFPAGPGHGTISMAALQLIPYGGLTRLGVSNAVTQQADGSRHRLRRTMG